MKSSKYIDVASCVQVIGSIYSSPSLLDQEDKYWFLEEDFPNELHRIIFVTLYNLHQLGSNSFSLEAVEDYLAQRPEKLAAYKSYRGAEWLTEASANASLSTFGYYYQRVKKMTLLREYDKLGLNLKWLYDPDNIMDVKKKQEQEDWLDNTPLNDIATKINDKIEIVKSKYVDDDNGFAEQLGDDAMALIEELRETPSLGYPLYGPYINTVTRGARFGKFFLRSAATGVGKAILNSTVIPTPNGDKRVDEIKVGDYLFDGYGKPTKVIGVFPQGKQEVWEITFKDGRKALCNKEHLWSFCTEGQKLEFKKARKFYTETLEQISKRPLYKDGHGYQILVPMQKAVEYEEVELSIAPYSFGLLLGDGSFRYDASQKALTYSSENEYLPSKIAEEMHWDYKKNSGENYSWTFEWNDDCHTHKNVWVEEVLYKYKELWNVKSDKKFIPRDYLESSIEQRLALLNGLLDSDGSVDKKGKISYHTNSVKLRDDVITLCRSLGYKATYLEDDYKDTSIVYKIEIAGTPEDKIKLFVLPRKKELINNWYISTKRKEHNLFNPIIDIKNLNYEEEMTCFLVDNDEHLFLMNDFIVTHNTRFIIADMCYIACSQMYDTNLGKWISTGESQPSLLITTEQDKTEVTTMCLAFLSGVNEEKILQGTYFTGEFERVQKAAQILKNGKLFFECISDFSMLDIESSIKRNIREHQVCYIAFDYIHSSAKVLMEISGKSGVKNLREDNILFLLSNKLKDLAVENNVFILSSTQLNADYKESEEPNQNLLRGSKAIADKIDMGMIMMEVNPTDLEKLQPILKKGGFEPPNVKMSVYKNRQGRWKNIYMWMKADRGSCRFDTMFVTDWRFNLQEMEDLKIKVAEESMF